MIKKKAKEGTRRRMTGQAMADAIIGMVHLFYQTQTARGFLKALIERLEERREEFH